MKIFKTASETVALATDRLWLNRLVDGDAQPAYRVLGDGTTQWGSGGGAATDANLYRGGTASLYTDGSLLASGYLQANRAVSVANQVNVGLTLAGAAAAQITFGADTNLYRNGANQLATQGVFTVGSTLYLGSAQDTNLYRLQAQVVKTDGQFRTAQELIARDGNVAQLMIGNVGPNAASGITFGSSNDTNLYRNAANVLKTDSDFVGGRTFSLPRMNMPYNGAGGDIIFGGDTNLYRAAAGILAAGNTFRVIQASTASEAFSTQIGGSLYLSVRQDGYMTWNADANLYRSFANAVATDSSFVIDNVNLGRGLYFGSALDTYLYRSAAGVLHTNGTAAGTTNDMFSAQRLAMRYGNDVANSGGIVTTKGGFQRISTGTSDVSTIYPHGNDGQLLVLQNVAGGSINFVTGSNISSAFTMAQGTTALLIFNAITNVWVKLA